jgi:two-component system, OmpR family, sensor kinase
MGSTASEDHTDSLSVSWTDIVRFVRQLSHDLRNHLNAAELQAVYIGELTGDAELKTEIKRLRATIAGLGAVLQKLSADLGQIKPTFMPYRAVDFVEDLRQKFAHDFPQKSAAVNWDVQPGDAALNVDPQLLQQALLELFANAFQHERGQGQLAATAKIDNDRFVFTLRESKAGFELATENWGREPLRKISQGHYGLGLNRVRVIVEAHGGELHAHYDPTESVLLTTITLPFSAEPS